MGLWSYFFLHTFWLHLPRRWSKSFDSLIVVRSGVFSALGKQKSSPRRASGTTGIKERDIETSIASLHGNLPEHRMINRHPDCCTKSCPWVVHVEIYVCC
ncbi:hypothetical protein KC19_N044100 [Ceratodon purpureus]|nr:hypothetical protein KC19_N044100 [Ceratodon purpureus]